MVGGYIRWIAQISLVGYRYIRYSKYSYRTAVPVAPLFYRYQAERVVPLLTILKQTISVAMARSRARRYAKHNTRTVRSTRLLTMWLCLLTYAVIQLKLYAATVCLHSSLGAYELSTRAAHETPPR
jgi:hypothetical protein